MANLFDRISTIILSSSAVISMDLDSFNKN